MEMVARDVESSRLVWWTLRDEGEKEYRGDGNNDDDNKRSAVDVIPVRDGGFVGGIIAEKTDGIVVEARDRNHGDGRDGKIRLVMGVLQ